MRCALCVIASVGALEAHAQRRSHSVRHTSRVVAAGRDARSRRAIAHRSARAAVRCKGACWRVRGAVWGTGDPLGMYALPKVHVRAGPGRLRPVPRPR